MCLLEGKPGVSFDDISFWHLSMSKLIDNLILTNHLPIYDMLIKYGVTIGIGLLIMWPIIIFWKCSFLLVHEMSIFKTKWYAYQVTSGDSNINEECQSRALYNICLEAMVFVYRYSSLILKSKFKLLRHFIFFKCYFQVFK